MAGEHGIVCLLFAVLGVVRFAVSQTGGPPPASYPMTVTPASRHAICDGTWNDFINTKAEGAIAVNAGSFNSCKQACVNEWSCTGVDWYPDSQFGQQCWLSGPWNSERLKGPATGTVHADLTRNSSCQSTVVPPTPSPGYELCYNDSQVQTASDRCNLAASVKSAYPYYIDNCRIFSRLLQCYYIAANTTCSHTAAFDVVSTRRFYLQLLSQYSSCSIDLNWLLGYPLAGNQCDQDAYVFCALQWTFVTYDNASDTFKLFSRGLLSTSQASYMCSAWNNLTSCAVQTRCTVADLSSMFGGSSYWQRYVVTSDVYRYMCNRSADDFRTCFTAGVLSGLERCEVIMNTKLSYPYGYSGYDCRVIFDYARCQSSVLKQTCSNETTESVLRASLGYYYTRMSYSYQVCTYESYVADTNYQRNSTTALCDTDAFFYCSSNSSVWNINMAGTINNYTSGRLSTSERSSICSAWSTLVGCVNPTRCSFTDIYQLSLTYNTYWSQTFNRTVMSFRYLCDSTIGFDSCYAAPQVQATLSNCDAAAASKSSYPYYFDSCTVFARLLQCYYVGINATCAASDAFGITSARLVYLQLYSYSSCQVACSPTWIEYPNSNVKDGTPNSASSTVNDCKSACTLTVGCTGIDWDPYSPIGISCWLSGTGQWNNGTMPGITHYYIVRPSNCNGLNEVLSKIPPVTQCNMDSYFVCVSKWPSVFWSAMNTFSRVNAGQLSRDEITSNCSNWKSFSSCVGATGCSFSNISTSLTSSYYIGLYNQTVSTYAYLCIQPAQDIVACMNASDVQTGLARCDTIKYTRQSYPYYYYAYSNNRCGLDADDMECRFEAIKTVCSNTTTQNVARVVIGYYLMANYDIYRSYGCSFDLADLLYGKNPAAACDSDAYFWCSSLSSSVWNVDVSGALDRFTSGRISVYERSLVCSTWTNFSGCVNETGCSFNDIYQLSYGYGPYYADRFNLSVWSIAYLCATPKQGTESCLSSAQVQSDISECDAAASSKSNYPYYYVTCTRLSRLLQCYYTRINSTCNTDLAYSIVAGRQFYLEKYQFTGCRFDLNALFTSIPPVYQCNEDSYFLCVSKSPDVFANAMSTFGKVNYAQMQLGEIASSCSAWNSFSACLNATGCSFSYVSSTFVSYYSYRKMFDAAVSSYANMCGQPAEDIVTCIGASDVQTGLTRCDTIKYAKQNFPYNYYYYSYYVSYYCGLLNDELRCRLKVLKDSCSNATAYNVAGVSVGYYLMSYYNSYYYYSYCSFDLGQLLYDQASTASCNYDAYFWCSSRTSLWNADMANILNRYTSGKMSASERSSVCGSWKNFTSCVDETGCSFYDIYQLSLNYYYSNGARDFNRTVSHFVYMCQSAQTRDTELCLNSTQVQNDLSECETVAASMSRYPYYYSSCTIFQRLLQCYYLRMTSSCTPSTVYDIAAGRQLYLQTYSYGGCQLNLPQLIADTQVTVNQCDEEAYFLCDSKWPNIMNGAIARSNQFYNGQFSTDQIASVCSDWNNFTLCVNRTRCSVDTWTSYLQLSSNYRTQYNAIVSSLNYLCGRPAEDISTCLTTYGVSSGIERCNRIKSAKQNSPYYYEYARCEIWYDDLMCRFKPLKYLCENATAVRIAGAYTDSQRTNYLYNYYNYYSCPFDFMQLFYAQAPGPGTCDVDGYFWCSAQSAVWSYNYFKNVLSQLIYAQVQQSQILRVCSTWTNFTGCVNQTGCSFTDIYRFSTNYSSYYANQFNTTVRVFEFVCYQDIIGLQQCLSNATIQANIYRCDIIAQMKLAYPYYLPDNVCNALPSLLGCYARAVQYSCYGMLPNIISYEVRYRQLIQSVPCNIDVAELINKSLTVEPGSCDYDSYFYCSYQTNIWSLNIQSIFSQLTTGRLQASDLQSLCGSWWNFTSCVNMSRCTLYGDIYQYLLQSGANSPNFNKTIDASISLCGTGFEVYVTNFPCYNSTAIQSGIAQCNAVALSMKNYPFYYYTDSLTSLRSKLLCYYNTAVPSCGQGASYTLAWYNMRYAFLFNGLAIDMDSLLNTTSVAAGVCYSDGFFTCAYLSSALSNMTSGTFSLWATGQLPLASLVTYCRNFTACVNASGCTFDDIYGLIMRTNNGYWYYQQNYNQSVRSFQYMCSRFGEYAANQPCYSSTVVQSGFRRCDTIVSTKTNYPYYMNNYASSSCTVVTDKLTCYYSAALTGCGRDAAYNLASYMVYNELQWRQSSCAIDVSRIANSSSLPVRCDLDSYFYCSSQTNVWSLGVQNMFSLMTTGQLQVSTLQSICGSWQNFSACTIANGCSFENDIYQYLIASGVYSYYYQYYYNRTIEALKIMCGSGSAEYVTNQPCYASLAVQSGITRCNGVQQTKQSYPFYYSTDTCSSLRSRLSCYHNASYTYCTNQTSFNFATFQFYYEKIYQSSTCVVDLDRLLNSSGLPDGCNSDGFFVCAYLWPSLQNMESNNFNKWATGQLTVSAITTYCSNFTTCTNATQCTFDDIYRLILSTNNGYWYYQQNYNQSVRSLQYMCSRFGEYTANQPCYSSSVVQSGFRRCDTVVSTKTNYPYYMNNYASSCTVVTDKLTCYYSAALTGCGGDAAYNLMSYMVYNELQWRQSSCALDVSRIVNASSLPVRCDLDNYFYCSSQTNVWSLGVQNMFSQMTTGQLQVSTLQSICGSWRNFSACTIASGCSFENDIYQYLIASGSGPYYYQYYYNRTIEALKIMCGSGSPEYVANQPCYASVAVQSGITRCNGVQQIKQSYPFYYSTDTCSSLRSRLSCYHNASYTYCTNQTSFNFVTFQLYYEQIYQSSTCVVDLDRLLNSSGLPADGCNSDGFFTCAYLWPSLQNVDSNNFNNWATGQLTVSAITTYCSNFTTCINVTQCTFDDIYRHILNTNNGYWYYQQNYNQSVRSLQYVCNHFEDYVRDQPCYGSPGVQSQLRRCDYAIESKRDYPYYLYSYSYSCSAKWERLSCYYNRVQANCTADSAYRVASYMAYYESLWQQSSCVFDLNRLLNASSALSGKCDFDSYFYCSYQKSIWSISVEYQLQSMTVGQLQPSNLMSSCGLWWDFSACVNSSRCTLGGDVTGYLLAAGINSYYYTNYYNRTAEGLKLMCDVAYQGYYASYPCYSNSIVQSGVSRCNALAQSKQNYPFYYNPITCLSLQNKVLCYANAARERCGDTALFNLATYNVYYVTVFQGTSCAIDLNQVINMTTISDGACNSEAFFACSYSIPALSNMSETTFSSWTRGQLALSTVAYYCSNFTACVNASGCSFDSIYRLIMTTSNGYWSYQQTYNQTVRSLQYMCSHLQEYTASQPCYSSTAVQSGFMRCDTIASTKNNNPYYMYNYASSCTAVWEKLSCYYRAAQSACGGNASYALATSLFNSEVIWRQSSCAFDLRRLLNSSAMTNSCDLDSYFMCSYQSNVIWSIDLQYQLSQMTRDQLSPSDLISTCRLWRNFSACANATGCTLDGDVYQYLIDTYTNSYYYRYYYNRSVEVMKFMCAAGYEKYIANQSCYLSTDVQSGIAQCTSGVVQTKQNYPFRYSPDSCIAQQSKIRCLYSVGQRSCNRDISYNFASYNLYYDATYQGLTCGIELERLLNTSGQTGGVCDSDGFFMCAYLWPALSNINAATFSSWANGDLSLIGYNYCSNFTSCMNATGCTYLDIYRLMQTTNTNWYCSGYYWSWAYSASCQQQYNQSTTSIDYMCTHFQNYLAEQPCYKSAIVQSGVGKCDAIAATKPVYPFNYRDSTCNTVWYKLSCHYDAAQASCGSSAAFNFASYQYQYQKLWETSSCVFDMGVLLNRSITTDTGCNANEFFYCAYLWPVLSNTVESTFSSWSNGRVSLAIFAAYCSNWTNLTTCMNSSECTFDDIYRYISTTNNDLMAYNRSTKSAQYMCSSFEDYVAGQPCYNSTSAQTGFRRCDMIAATKPNYPFYYNPSTCTALQNKLTCYSNATEAVCGSNVSYKFASYMLHYDVLWGRSSCGINLYSLLNNTTAELNPILNRTGISGGACNSEAFFACSYSFPTLSYINENAFGSWARGQLALSTVAYYCSNFTSCVNTSGCTFDAIYRFIMTTNNGYWYNQQVYNQTVRSLQYMCSHLQEYTANQPCFSSSAVQPGFGRCDTIASTKTNNPYYMYNYAGTCASLWDKLSCYYRAAESACGSNSSYALATNLFYSEIVWRQSSCVIDLSSLLNSSAMTKTCDLDSYFTCSYQSNAIWSINLQNQLSRMTNGQLSPSDLLSTCRTWRNFSACVNATGCTLEGDVYQYLVDTRTDSYYYRYYYNRSVEALKLMCGSGYEEYIANQSCYISTDVQSGITQCTSGVVQTKQNNPFQYVPDSCTAQRSKIRCLYSVAQRACSRDASYNFASYNLYYDVAYQGSTCGIELERLLSTSGQTGGVCDSDGFFMCATVWPALSNINAATFSSWAKGELSLSGYNYYCGNFTSCVNATGCTYLDIYRLIQTTNTNWYCTYYYYVTSCQKQYNQSTTSVDYMCSHSQDYTTYRSCYTSVAVQSEFRRCDIIASAKTNYPYNMNSYASSCTFVWDKLSCHYSAAESTCGSNSSYVLATNLLYGENVWKQSPCVMDLTRLLNSSAMTVTCDLDSYFVCSNQSNAMWSIDIQNQLSQMTMGQLSPSDLLSTCSKWRNFSACANATGCTLEGDVYQYLIDTNVNLGYYNRTVEVLKFMCGAGYDEYISNRSCYLATDVQSGITQCTSGVVQTKQNYPFRYSPDTCIAQRSKIRCLYSVAQRACSIDASYNLASYNLYYDVTYQGLTCGIELERLLNTSGQTGGVCDSDGFFMCATVWPALSNINAATFKSWANGDLSFSGYNYYCGNFTSCVNATGCTYLDIYRLIQTTNTNWYCNYYWYSAPCQQQYNQSSNSVDYMCAHFEDYLSEQPCYKSTVVQSGVGKCDAIAATKPVYPFNYRDSTCNTLWYKLSCHYDAALSTCGSSAAFNFASYQYHYQKLWETSSCVFDMDVLLNRSTTTDTGCNANELFYCAYLWPVLSNTVESTFSSWSNGRVSLATFAAYCSNWTNLTTCINSSGCTFDDIYRYIATTNSYSDLLAYNRSTRSAQYMCNNYEDYVASQPCYNSTPTQSGFRRCDALAATKPNSPFYYYASTCTALQNKLACYTDAAEAVCSRNVSYKFASYMLYYEILWRSSSCYTNLDSLLNNTAAVAGCNSDEFFYCDYKYHVLSYFDSSAFSSWITGQFSLSAFSSYCSIWSNFSACMNVTGCSFGDIYQLILTKNYGTWYYQQYFNGTGNSLQFMCSRYQDYLSFRVYFGSDLVQSCSSTASLKQTYPFNNVYRDSCRNQFDQTVCTFRSLLSVGNETVGLNYLEFVQRYNEIWTPSCAVNTTLVANTTYPGFLSCTSERYLRCFSTSDLRSFVYRSYSYRYLLAGSFDWNYYCAPYRNLTACLGCSPRDTSIVATMLNFENVYRDENTMTLTGLSGLCSVSSQDHATFSSCFSRNNFYDTLYSECRYKAYTYATQCEFRKYWGRCFFEAVTTQCSFEAARFLTLYLVNGWQAYLQYNYGCTLATSDIIPSCNETDCVSEMKSVSSELIPLLETGQLTAENLTLLCLLVNDSSNCIKQLQQSLCPVPEVRYRTLFKEILPYVCLATNQQRYISNQQCFTGDIQSYITSYLQNNDVCQTNRTLVSNLYNKVNASCGASAASSIASYSSHLKSLRSLDVNQTTSCTSGLYPIVGAPPQFIGPVIVYNSSFSRRGPCSDYYFICRINYTRPTADDAARFDVSLTFDGRLAPTYTYKTTTSAQLDVVFKQTDVRRGFGTKVSCAVRSYWSQLPPTEFFFSTNSYFVGIKYWTNNSNQQIQIYETTRFMPVYFQATVPMICPHCSITLQLLKHTGLVVSSCTVNFTSTEPPFTVHRMDIQAVQTPGSNSRVAVMKFKQVYGTCENSPWIGLQLNDIQVLIIDQSISRSCVSQGDPHIRTFDDVYYNVYFAGDFILWRSNVARLVEVHARFQSCFAPRQVTCTCAVAFREGNNIVGVYACDVSRPPIAITYLRDPSTPEPNVQIDHDGLYFYITMPSGRSMSVVKPGMSAEYVDVTVYAISEDIGVTEGLCGIFNGRQDDDIIPKGSTVADTNHYEPVQFAKSYMVSAEESYINSHIYPPTCINVNITQPGECQCGQLDPDNCEAVIAVANSLTSAVTYSTYYTDSCIRRQKREAITGEGSQHVISPNELTPKVPDPAPDNAIHPDVSADDENEARNACESPLLESPIYAQCSLFTAVSKKAIIDSCILDAKLTGDAATVVNGILAKFQDACLRGIQESDNRTVDDATKELEDNTTRNASSEMPTDILQTPLVASVLQSVIAQMCPGQPECSGNGTCNNSQCICDTGFVGADCSISAYRPPVITGLVYGAFCDARSTEVICRLVSIYVSGFSYSQSFACRSVSNGTTFYPATRMVSYAEIQVILPISPLDQQSTTPYYLWTISVSNDNVTFSNEVQVFVFDSKCLVCSNVTSTCDQKNETCLIDGNCFATDELNPKDVCFKCSPGVSNSLWTYDNTTDGCLTTAAIPEFDVTPEMIPVSETILSEAGLPWTGSASTIHAAVVTTVESYSSQSPTTPHGPVETMPSYVNQSHTTASQLPSTVQGATTPGQPVTAAHSYPSQSPTTSHGPASAGAGTATSSPVVMPQTQSSVSAPSVGATSATKTATSTVPSRMTTVAAGPTWNAWSEWSSCGQQCDNRISTRTRSCPSGNSCVGDSVERVNCLTTSCPAPYEELPQGVLLVAGTNEAGQLASITFLTYFFDSVVDIINTYCTKYRKYCCDLLLADFPGSQVSPTAGDMTIATRAGTYVGRSYPQYGQAGNAIIKIISVTSRSTVFGKCVSGSVSRKRQADSPIYISKLLLTKALEGSASTLSNQTNLTIVGVTESPNVETTTSPPTGDKTRMAIILGVVLPVAGLIILLIGCFVYCRRPRAEITEFEPAPKRQRTITQLAANSIYSPGARYGINSVFASPSGRYNYNYRSSYYHAGQ